MRYQKVLITDEWFMVDEVINDEHLAHLKSIATIERKLPTSDEEMIECIRDADAIILGDFTLSGRIIEKAERLKIIARVGVGYDNVDLIAATGKKIIVTNVPGALSDSVADHTILLILAVARRIVAGDEYVRHGRWTDFFRHAPSFELSDKILGLIGFGAIGRAVAKRAAAFNMTILVYDPYVTEDRIAELGYRRVDLNTLLRESDVVSIHTPLTSETKMMIGERELNLMKKSAILINTARGEVVHESALTEALKQKKFWGAGLDVMTSEPPQLGSPILELDNVTLTPHSAGFSIEAMKRLWLACSDAVDRVLRGELPRPPANIVNSDVLKLLRDYS